MHRSRRWLVAPALSLALVAAACGGGSSAGKKDDAAALPPCPVKALDSATGTTDIVLWYQISGKAAQTLEKMVDEYNASQTKVKVRAELQGASYEELLRKYEQAIPTNALPNIIVAEDTATQFLVDSGTVIPAQSCFDADGLSTAGFNQAAVNHFTTKGALWPGTASISDLLTYYNKNHLRRAGLDPNVAPQTLADVRSMAEKIKAANIGVDTPVVLRMDSWLVETQLTGSKQPLVNNDNGYGSGQTTEALFDTDQTTQIFDWIAGMEKDGLLTATQATDGNFDHYLAMAGQKASITMETSTAATTIESYLGGDKSVATGLGTGTNIDTSGLDVGAAPVFGVDAAGKAQIGGNGFFMTAPGTDVQKAAAWDFLKWWNQEPQQVQWHVEGSYLPFLTSAASDPAVQTFWDTTLSGSYLKIAYQELTQNIDPNFTGALIGPYDKFRVSMRNALASVAFQKGDPATAIATAKDETDAALTQYNDTNF
jgi:sn-glycerol 3-phosphate transport system substrate-binding protein